MRARMIADTALIGLLVVVVLVLSACGPRVVYRDRIETVSVPVAQPCAGKRPALPPALRERYSDATWAAMDLVQRTAAVGARAIERMDYATQLEAATAACPDIAEGK